MSSLTLGGDEDLSPMSLHSFWCLLFQSLSKDESVKVNKFDHLSKGSKNMQQPAATDVTSAATDMLSSEEHAAQVQSLQIKRS